MERIILYHYQSPDLNVRIEAFFRNEKLIIEGYDVGKSVDEWFGDSDYEYSTTLSGEELDKLYLLFHVDKINQALNLRYILSPLIIFTPSLFRKMLQNLH